MQVKPRVEWSGVETPANLRTPKRKTRHDAGGEPVPLRRRPLVCDTEYIRDGYLEVASRDAFTDISVTLGSFFLSRKTGRSDRAQPYAKGYAVGCKY